MEVARVRIAGDAIDKLGLLGAFDAAIAKLREAYFAEERGRPEDHEFVIRIEKPDKSR